MPRFHYHVVAQTDQENTHMLDEGNEKYTQNFGYKFSRKRAAWEYDAQKEGNAKLQVSKHHTTKIRSGMEVKLQSV